MTRASAGTRSPARSTTTSPGTEIARGDRRFLAIAQHMRRRGGHSSQCVQRRSGAVFLDEAEEHGEQHDDGDHDRFEGVAEETRDDCGAEENQNQRVLKLSEEGMPGATASAAFAVRSRRARRDAQVA